MNNEVTYKIGNESIIDDVRELWSELNQLNIEKSLHFEKHYRGLSFQDKKRQLLKRAHEGRVFVIIACDNDEKVGHCIASFVDTVGTIESLFVKPRYRKERVGSALMEQALGWLRSNNPQYVSLRVAVGNEEVFNFYSKYGFKPRSTELQIETYIE